MIITGIFVNGPYAMITTAVSADLVSTSISIYMDGYGYFVLF